MGAPSGWERVNPTNAVDQLPQPFRAINKILEEILQAVGERIGEIESRRKSEDYEFGLPEARASKMIPVAGSVTCAHTEPRGLPRMAIGTSNGEVWLIDTRAQEVVSQRPAFTDEAAHCIALSSDGVYAQRPPPPGMLDPLPPPRAGTKLIVSGRFSSRILVFDVRKEAYGVQLKPACAIQAPEPEGVVADGDAEEAASRPPAIEQLHVRGTNDGIWVLALMFDHTIRAYVCPLGVPEDNGAADGGGAAVGGTFSGAGDAPAPIMEDEEEEGEEDAGQGEEDFAGAVQVKTPTFIISVQGLAPLPGFPEPGLAALHLTAFAARAETRSVGFGTAAKQVPLICMASSPDSNVVLGYSMPAPGPLVASDGLDAEALLKLPLTPLGDLREPAQAQPLRPRRRWELPGQTTAAAASPDGCLFVAGGSRGSLALVDAPKGLSLRTMLPGHYAAVTAVAFHRSDVLVSAGEDSWVHHYSMHDNTLLVRYLCAAPPASPPVGGLATAQTLPVALTLDASGGLRMLDLRRQRKMARATCLQAAGAAGTPVGGAEGGGAGAEGGGGGAAAVDEDGEGHGPEEDELPRRVLASATGFCVVCEASLDDAEAPEGEGEASQELVGEGGEGEGAGTAEGEDLDAGDELDRSWLVLFDFAATLKALYPGLAHKIDPQRGSEGLYELFKNLSPDEASKEPGQATLHEASPKTPTGGTGTRASIPAATLSGPALSKPGDTGPVAAHDVTRAPKRMSERQQAQQAAARAAAAPVAKLTAENLMRMGRTSSTMSQTGGSVLTGPAGGRTGIGSGDVSPKAQEKDSSKLHGAENWQVSARRYLRASFAQKEARARRIHQRLEQLRKDLGDT